jgi:site-specific DNA-methyltransferase (adenine-specific)
VKTDHIPAVTTQAELKTGRAAQIHGGMFTSAADDWTTPDDFYRLLDAEFGFTLDPCCYAQTAKCAEFYTREDDGLSQEWRGRVFMNPPYGRAIGAWVRKAYEAAQTTADVVVCLIPARTCSKWWHDYCMRAAEVRLVCGRLRFGGQRPEKGHNAPFPNAVIVFRRGQHKPALSTIYRSQSPLFQEAA